MSAYPNDRIKPKQDEFNKPLGGKLPPLPPFPTREWLTGRISVVEYGIAYFNNKPIVCTDSEDNELTDERGDPIYRREFNITILVNDHYLPNNEPRKVWLRLGASLGKKANLPKFLKKVIGEGFSETPAEIINDLQNKDIKFQMADKVSESTQKEYQSVIWDSVELWNE